MKWPGPSRPSSALGLVVDGPLIHLAERDVPTVGPSPSPGATLSLDLSAGDPVALGRQLRAELDKLAVRTRRCVIGLPPEWVMTVSGPVPELPPADRQSYLALEAEKGFPCDPTELQIATTEVALDGSAFVAQFAVRREQVDRLEAIVRHAGLRPVGMSLPIAALAEPGEVGQLENGRLLVVHSARGASTLLSVGSAIVGVRVLDGTFDEPAALARELRITLEDLPPVLRSRLGSVSIFGPVDAGRRLAETLGRQPAFSSLRVEAHESTPASVCDQWLQRSLGPGPRRPDFLPARPSRWKTLLHRYNARRVGMIGAAAGALLLGLLGTMLWQEYRSWSLRTEWDSMKPQVEALNALQDRIREFRSWHDTSFTTLSILKLVTDIFPETGSVTAKSIEIKGHSAVTVTGSTRENAALLNALDRLRQRPEVTNLKIEQIRGKSPAQFTFSFQLARTPSS